MTYIPKPAYQGNNTNSSQNNEFGGLSKDVARMMGLNTARAMADYMANGSQGKFGVVEDDFRCDADSGDKLGLVARLNKDRQ